MKNFKNQELSHFKNFKILNSQNSQKIGLETGPSRAEDSTCKFNHVTFGKGEVEGSQHTIDNIDTTLTARYVHT